MTLIELKLNIGCGTHTFEDWINVDLRPLKGIDVTCNLMEGLPFEDQTVDLIFTEHMFEHFTFEEGQTLLKDWYRVLKPGGIVRIAVPGLTEAVHKYLTGDWKQEPWVRLWGFGNKTDAEYLNAIFYNWGHKCLYDEPLLCKGFENIGFTTKRQQYQDSDVQELKGLERRAENESTLIIEGTKVIQ